MRVTLRDVAKRLNVSHATVSRALNRPDDPFISAATRERVRQVANEMGYRPNLAARSLVTGRTGILSLWLWSESIQESFQASVSHCVHAQVQSSTYDLMVNLVGYKTLERAKQNGMPPLGVDGIICHEAAPAVTALLGANYAQVAPIVSTGAYNWLEGVDTVGVDLSEGAEEAVAHLISSGRRRIAYLSDDLMHRAQDPRFLAYTKLLDEAGLQGEFIQTGQSRSSARKAMAEYAAEHGHPEAIFCHNDDLALGAYRGLCDLGIRVPSDVALIGCDGIEDTEYLETPISTIVQPLESMFTVALQYLEQRISNPTAPVQVTWFKPRLVIRESSST